MANILFYRAGTTPACGYAAEALKARGIPFIGHVSPEITHLLLDVPGFGPDGQLRGGGDGERLLRMLPGRITVFGGNLEQDCLEGYKKQDLLRDEGYLAQNAWITAECALKVAAPLLTSTLRDTPTLVLGWGRIGKCLAQLLKAIGCPVTVMCRKEADLAMLRAFDYEAISTEAIPKGYRLIFNTAPAMVLTAEKLENCGTCVKIDLASRRGIEGEDVVWARGLPGIHAPESSGRLIANTVIRMLKEEAL